MSLKYSLYMIIILLAINVCSCYTVKANPVYKTKTYESAIVWQDEGVTIPSDTGSGLSYRYIYPDTEGTVYIYDDPEFYMEYSRRLGIEFEGTENKELIMTIDEWFGTPFKMGGCSKYGVDCSCFVKKVYENVYGIELNRTSRKMYYEDLIPVKKRDLQEGDILCFKIRGRRISHVGIYLKDNKFVHSSRSKGVMINDLNEQYYKRRFFSGGRVKERYINFSKR